MRADDPQLPAACLLRLEPARHAALHPELDRWRENVGAPVAIDAAEPAAPHVHGVDVLCWNVAIGRGRLGEVIGRLRTGLHGSGPTPQRPLVVLLQEAFRSDDSVPAAGGSHHGGHTPRTAREDVVEVARAHGMSLRYSPSMRNGAHRSDRGNAILASVSLADAHAVLLPHVRQRRVAVVARLAGQPRLSFVSAHLDTRGQPRRQPPGPTSGPVTGAAGAPAAAGAPVPGERRRGFAAGRTAQAAALGEALRELEGSVVLGADLNSYFGVADPAVRALVASGMHLARRVGDWRHTLHTPLRLLLDHVLYRSDGGWIADAAVARLDQAPDDRSRGVFGSDHHPLLARLNLERNEGNDE
jgi:endonuclease/exonuclease/phosphatase family metal-dependent hydrolase